MLPWCLSGLNKVRDIFEEHRNFMSVSLSNLSDARSIFCHRGSMSFGVGTGACKTQ